MVGILTQLHFMGTEMGGRQKLHLSGWYSHLELGNCPSTVNSGRLAIGHRRIADLTSTLFAAMDRRFEVASFGWERRSTGIPLAILASRLLAEVDLPTDDDGGRWVGLTRRPGRKLSAPVRSVKVRMAVRGVFASGSLDLEVERGTMVCFEPLLRGGGRT